jgi:hypothetical protein
MNTLAQGFPKKLGSIYQTRTFSAMVPRGTIARREPIPMRWPRAGRRPRTRGGR